MTRLLDHPLTWLIAWAALLWAFRRWLRRMED
jgi:hypothetical protein